MGPAHGHLVLLVAAVALLSAGFLPHALAKKGGAVPPAVADICSRTPFPDTCKSTAGRHASKYPVIDVVAVLNMQVDAFSKRTAHARERVTKVSRGAQPQQTQALSFCDTMYMNTQDTIGAAERAITFRDKATAKIMLQLAVQDFESCDRPFKQSGINNPLEKIDVELNQMAQNCMTLASMI
uniref:Pectinesterase inhibitor domain-containing protein n=1 Tax=Oryza meridionalis TaxID=40149 RepID=A0A0E0DZF1_9ORYZ